MKLLLSSILLAVIVCFCEARTECLSVRGHVRCGHGSLGQSSWSSGSSSGGHHGSGRPSSSSGSSWGHGSSGSSTARSRDPIFIKLIDEDTGGPDDWMDETYASSSGAFQLHGCASDGPLGGHIEPMLRIYHKCKGTPKRFTVEIPVEFIGKEYNISTVFNLQGPLQNEQDERHYPVPTCTGRRNKFFLF